MKTLSMARSGAVLPLLLAGCLATAMGQTVTVTSPDGSVTYNSAHPITISAPIAGVAAPITVRIDSQPTGQPVSVALNMPTPIPYLFISQTTGTTPLNVTISDLQQGVVPQTFTGSLNVSIGGTQVATIPVNFTIGSSGGGGGGIGSLFLTPSSLTFNQTGAAVPTPVLVGVLGGFTGTPISASVTAGVPWLQAQGIGSLGGVGSGVLVSISTSGLSTNPATYTGNVHVVAGGQQADLPVTLNVNGGGSGGGGGTGGVTASPTTLNFTYQPNGNNTTSQNFTLTSTGASFAYTLQKPADATWLTLSSTGGVTVQNSPSTITVTVTPGTLSNGTYQTDVQVLGLGQTTPAQTVHVTLTIGSSAGSGGIQSGAVPFGLLFNLPATQTTPVTQQLLVTTQGSTPINFGASIGSLSCSPAGLVPQVSITGTGTTGTAIPVTVTPSGVVNGRVDCTATITISGGTGNPLSIPVRISQASTPVLNICTTAVAGCQPPQRLNLTAVQGQTATATLNVLSSDPNTHITFTASATPGGSWLTLGAAQPTNQISTNTSYPLQVNANAASLSPGSYEGIVKFTSNNPADALPTGEWTIPVTFTVTSSGGGGGGGTAVTANPSSVTLNANLGSTTALTQSVVLDASGTVLPYSAGITYNNVNEPAWLSLANSANGPFVSTVVGSTPSTLYLSAQPAGLAAGEHKATITVQVTGGTNVTIPVSLVVGSQLTLNTQALTFTGPAGSATNPANQTFTITAAAGQIPYTVQVNATSCGGAWLAATPQSGTASAGTPATVTVSAGGLSGMQTVGACTGTITVSSSGLPAQTVNVTLNVTAPPTPQIIKVVSAASFLPGPIAPGEIIAVGGSNLGPATQTLFQLQNGSVPTNLAGTRVLFDGIPGAMLSISPVPGNDPTLNQVNVIVPYEVAGRAQTSITVERFGVASAPIIQAVAPTAPALFLANATGDIAMFDNTKGTYVTAATPASIGDIVTMYGTGEGIVSPLPATGSVTGTNLANIGQISAPYAVRLGGAALGPNDVQYVGPAPGQVAGVFQVNFRVPNFIKDPKVPVAVAIGTGGNDAPTGTGYMYVTVPPQQ